MPVAEVNGARIHHETDGHGPPVFVLHGGLGLDHVLYRRTLAPLADAFRLTYLDFRGNGRSLPLDVSDLTIEQLADDVKDLADHLGVDRFSLLGHSYGGFVAQELAIRHGHRLDALVLVSTTPGQLGATETADEEQGPPPPPAVVELMAEIPLTDADHAAHFEALLPFYLHRVAPSHVAQLAAGTVHRAAARARGFEVLRGWSSVDRLASITVPTLLIAGRHDVFTSYPQSDRIARRIAGSEVQVLEHSAHFPWIEEPDRFAAIVHGFLRRALAGR